MVQRDDHPEDAAFINRVLKEEEAKAEEAKKTEEPSVSASAVLNSVTSKLDDFLSMVEDDEDEELVRTTSSRCQTKTISPSFTCALCHSSETDSMENTPMLLCHVNYDRLPRCLFCAA